MAVIDGTDNGETLEGTPDNDTIHGKGGNDIIHASAGNDTLEGGDGNDTLYMGPQGDDHLFGQGGDDTIVVGQFDNWTPADSISGGDGYDTLQIDYHREGHALDVTPYDIDITGLIIPTDIEHLTYYDPALPGTAERNTIVLTAAQFANFQAIDVDYMRLTTAGTITVTTQDHMNKLTLSNGDNNITVNAVGLEVFAGSGNDTMIGGAGGQYLYGGEGQNHLEGGEGNDLLVGGNGQNYIAGGEGNDAITGGSSTLEFLDGGAGDDVITDYYPGIGATIIGGAGSDRLVVGGSQGQQGNPNLDLVAINGIEGLTAGVVKMSTTTAAQFGSVYATEIDYTNGGAITVGSNYRVSEFHLNDVATQFDGSQVDISNFNNVLTVVGGAGDDWIKTGAGNDVLKGGAGADTLIGGAGNDSFDGGAGADKMYGGLGNDNYVVDSLGDIVFENAGEGTDTVTASVDHYLFANIESLIQSGSADIYGVGNDLANSIMGNSGANLLLGGNGNDTINGNAGNDTIYGESGNDVLLGGNGIDYLAGGIGNDDLNGGDQADALYGEDGNDTLDGGTGFFTDILVGGDGNDVLHGDSHLGDYDEMDGGAGDDTFYVDTPDDKTYEAAGGGTDTVIANISGAGYYLYANTENLTLMGSTPFGVGNELANVMTGSAAANWLLGGDGNDTLNGKQGNDVLFGQGGADTFVFEHGTNVDTIGDFVAGTDKIDLHAIGYTWDQVQASFHQNGGDLAIDLGGGDVVILQGVTAAQLHQSDFIL